MSTAVVLALVGPGEQDVSRLADLLDSLEAYEPDLPCVLVDDACGARELEPSIAAHHRRRVTIVPHPRQRVVAPLNGVLITGVLAGLAWLRDLPDLDFVLKIDLDALVIGPFREQVSTWLRHHPETGVVGCRGETCDRTHPRYLQCLHRPSPFAVALEILEMLDAPPDATDAGDRTRRITHPVAGTLAITAAHYEALMTLRPAMAQAVANGHRCADYCQGGAYAVRGSLVRRMDAAGCFDDVTRWLPLPTFGEDEAIAMYSYAAGLRPGDMSGEGQPFGVSYRGLPFEPVQLVDRQHALVHSLRRDPHHDEAAIRMFFSDRRRQLRAP